MGDRQIDNMNVVANAGTVRSGIITAPDIDLFFAFDRNSRNKGNQVRWNSRGIFTDPAAFMSSDGIEVSQDRDAPVGRCASLVA